MYFKGVRGLVSQIGDLESLAPHRCRFEFCQGLWILSCEEAVQLAYGKMVVLQSCLLVPEIMHLRSSSTSNTGKSPYNLYSVGAM